LSFVLSFFLWIGVLAVVLAGLLVFAFEGFRNGDFTGEALARALRKDLEAAAGDAREDRVPPA
jgi:hypothetical protein